MNRFKNALQVVSETSSPLTAAACLLEAVTDISERGGGDKQVAEDPAVKILTYHLGHLCRTSQLDNLGSYHEAISECRDRASRPVLSVVGNGTGAASVVDLHDFASRIALGEISPEDVVEEARKLILGCDAEAQFRAPGM